MDTVNHDEAMLDAIEPSIEQPISQDERHLGSFASDNGLSGVEETLRIANGLGTGTQSPIPMSQDESLASSPRDGRGKSEEANGLITKVSNLLTIDSAINTPPPKRASSDQTSHAEAPERHQLQVAMLPTGLCYDVRMRFHCEIMPLNSTDDHHPEEPRRIYAIYQELCKAGLVDDPMSTRPLVPQPLLRILARKAEPGEICLVHDPRHYDFVKSLPSMFLSSSHSSC